MRRRTWLGLSWWLSAACAVAAAPLPERPAPSQQLDSARAPAAAASTPAVPGRTAITLRADDGHALTLWARTPARAKGAIVLLHGRTWSGVPDFDLPGRSLMEALAQRGWASYALDLRGYGATARDASGWNTPDRAARDLGVAVAHVRGLHPELAPPVVLGWSLGSLVAQLHAQREPASLSALVLYGYPRDPDRPAGTATGPGAAAKPPRQANTAAAAASDFITPGAIDRAGIDAFVAAALAADPIRADWRAMDEFTALDPAAVDVPTLLVHGAGDPFAKLAEHAKLFVRLGHPDRAWVMIPGGDHAAHLEACAPAFVHAVLGFVERPH